jgi:integrase
MSAQSYGATSRQPVYSGTRRIPGLYERKLANGGTVYEAATRLDGKVTRRRLNATTKTDAMRELEALRVDAVRGEAHRSPTLAATVAELAREWIAHLDARVGDSDPRRRRSTRTIRHYDEQLKLHVLPLLGSRIATELTVADVRRLLDALAAKRIRTRGGKTRQLAPRSRSGLLGILSGLLTFGVRQGQLPRNVVRDLDRDDRPGSRRRTEPRYLTAAEIEALLVGMTDTFRPVAATCAYAGLRLSEALGLRWRDLDLKAGSIAVTGQLGPNGERAPTKTEASLSSVPILPALGAELRAHRAKVAERSLANVKPDALVFTTATGRPHGRRNLLRAVYAAGDAAGLNPDGFERVGVHDLRHSFVALALAAGLTLPETAALARHANPRVTLAVYAGLTTESREQLAVKLAASGFGA